MLRQSFCVGVIALICACDDVPFGPPEEQKPPAAELPTTDEISSQFFDVHCTGCHGENSTPPNLERNGLESLVGTVSPGYAPRLLVVAGDPESSVVYTKVAGLGPGASMPLGASLDDDEIDFLARWIRSLEPSGGNPIPDAGTRVDAGAPVDGGSGPVDAGPPPDAGNQDAGTLEDAGIWNDSGYPDAGYEDAGNLDDAGPPVDPDLIVQGFGNRCTSCHAADAASPRMPYLEEADICSSLLGTESSSRPGLIYVVPGNPEQSFLYRKVVGPLSPGEGSMMPLGGMLNNTELETLRRWIEQGAPLPEDCP